MVPVAMLPMATASAFLVSLGHDVKAEPAQMNCMDQDVSMCVSVTKKTPSCATLGRVIASASRAGMERPVPGPACRFSMGQSARSHAAARMMAPVTLLMAYVSVNQASLAPTAVGVALLASLAPTAPRTAAARIMESVHTSMAFASVLQVMPSRGAVSCAPWEPMAWAARASASAGTERPATQ